MAITNPTRLVDEFKKSGEFDRLRRELLSQFQRSDGISIFKSRIEDTARQRLTSDPKLQYLPQESVHRELMQEMDRYPTVERAATDVEMLSDPSFAANINKLVQGILRENKEPEPRAQNEDDDTVTLIRPNHAPPGSPSRLLTMSTLVYSPNVTSSMSPSTALPGTLLLRTPKTRWEKEKMHIIVGGPKNPESSMTAESIIASVDRRLLVDISVADQSPAPGNN